MARGSLGGVGVGREVLKRVKKGERYPKTFDAKTNPPSVCTDPLRSFPTGIWFDSVMDPPFKIDGHHGGSDVKGIDWLLKKPKLSVPTILTEIAIEFFHHDQSMVWINNGSFNSYGPTRH
ncbi:hypothetical protein QJS10_CPA07g01008 [Acorus calamus]|uniref:Uncharacterized protein n=1 Tax=Acorus calamus TaxID=4465 RepID=A0AAV9EHD8_ACOCL|nr:hypothetical protein QJS10_CPA07g01008 [Acorus calamus]